MLKETLKRLWNEEDAVSATEYGIIAGLLGLGIVWALREFKGDLIEMFGKAGVAVKGD